MLKAKNGEKSEYANKKMPLQKSKKWATIDCKGKKKTLLTVMFEILTQMCWDNDRNARDIVHIFKISSQIHEKFLYLSDHILVIIF